MTPEEFDRANYEYLASYVKAMRTDKTEITKLMNSTLAQLVQTVKREINVTACENDGNVSGGDVVRIIVSQLRQCIIDLEQILNSGKEAIQ